MSTASPLVGFATPPGDFVSHMFGMVFGPIWNTISKQGLNLAGLHNTTPIGPLGAGFFVLNGLVFTFATFYIVKIIFEGVAGTAYHGEWLGKAFHTFWTPMRIVLMLSLIAPVAGGYSTAQIIVLWTAHKALGVADRVAIKSMAVVAKQGAVFNDPAAPTSKKLAANLFYDYVCMDTLNDRKLSASKPLIHVRSLGNKRWTEYQFSGVGRGLPAETCGAVKIPTPPTEIAFGENAGMNAMLQIIKPAAARFEKIVSGEDMHPELMPKNLITNAARVYTTDLLRSVHKLAQQKNKGLAHGWEAEVKADGFAAIGGYMTKIAAYDRSIAKLARFQPSITPPLHMKVIGLQGYDVRTEIEAARAYVHARNPGLANPTALPGSIPTSQVKGKGWFAKQKTEIVNGENRIVSAFNSFGSSSDPLGALQALGVRLVSITTLLIGGVVLIGGLGSLVLMPAVLALFGVLFPMLIVGVTLGYIIPMLPYLVLTMAVVGWVGAVITAVAGASLWAAVHAVPDASEGFVPGAATQGYRLLMSLFAKPSFIVIGYIASLLLFDAGAWLVNKTFLHASRSVLGGAGSNSTLAAIFASFVAILSLGIVAVVIYWKLADWCFGLIHSLPDKALEWMGLSDVSIGEEHTHDNIVGMAITGHQKVQHPSEHLARLTNKNERGKGNPTPKLDAPPADAAEGPAGDT